MAQHRVERPRGQQRRGVQGVAGHGHHPVPDCGGLGGELGGQAGEHRGRCVQAGHVMALPGQPEQLSARAAAHVQDARGRRGQVGGQLPGD